MPEAEHERIVHVDETTYPEAASDRPVLLEFWAEWCGPRRALDPAIEDLVEEHPPLAVAEIDADETRVGDGRIRRPVDPDDDPLRAR